MMDNRQSAVCPVKSLPVHGRDCRIGSLRPCLSLPLCLPTACDHSTFQIVLVTRDMVSFISQHLHSMAFKDKTNRRYLEASIIARDAPADLDEHKARPKWIFSSYGPVKTAAVSLMEENEYSSEEIRLRYYQAAAAGQDAQADQEATQMYQKISQDYQNILNNVNNIAKFLEDGEKTRPNRHDFTNVSLFDGKKTRDQFIEEFGRSAGPAFGGASNTFGSSSKLGSGSGNSGFGQNQNASSNPFSKPPTSTFGQPAGPSAFGSKPAFGHSGFGGAASGGSAATPAFGQSSTPAFGQSTFGKPATGSGFGQPAFGASGFGQGAQKNAFAPGAASSGFGQSSSTFGQPAQTTTAFGQPAQSSTGFGQPSQAGTAFGQPSQPTSSFGQPSQPTSAFGQPSQPSSGFGQPSQPAPSSAFGQPSQPTSAFGQPSNPTSAFGQPSQGSTFGKSAFGQSAQPNSIFTKTPQQSSGLSTAFGQPAAPSSGFGQNAGFGKPKDQDMDSEPTQQRTNPFGTQPSSSGAFGTQPSATPTQPQSQPPPPSNANAPASAWNPENPLLGKPAAPLHITQRLPPQPPTFDPSGRLSTFRGQRVTYIAPKDEKTNLPDQYQDIQAAKVAPFPCYTRPDTRELEKIWFPNGSAEEKLQSLSLEGKRRDFEGGDDGYTDQVRGAYQALFETGQWGAGGLPLVPPRREMVAYDF